MSVAADRAGPLALSIKQPWAELIMLGRKSIEVRTWTTEHRGRLYIHTGQKAAEPFLPLFPDIDASFLGGFIGFVELTDVILFTQASWSRLRPEHRVPGPKPTTAYGWRLEGPRRLISPLRWSGSLGLFRAPSPVVDSALSPGG